MYTTSQLVERLKLQGTNWTTAQLLPIIDEVNNEMMKGDFEHSIVIDTTTGLPPVLATTAGTRHYDMPDNCRKVADILVEEDWNNGNFHPYDRYGNWHVAAWRGRKFYSVPGTSRLRTLTENATYTFRDDPGTTTTKFLGKYWREPTRIQNVLTQIDVPGEDHAMFLDGCVFRLRALEYGGYDNWYKWLEMMEMKFTGKMNYNPPMERFSPIRYC